MVNGVHVSENEKILQKTLREEWGWEGLVMSDWYVLNIVERETQFLLNFPRFGTYSTSDAVNAGLDPEMPGKT
jgi:beta-glucosidase